MAEPVVHSVKIIEELCRGCTHCVRICPVQAIRVRLGKARIIESLCIDCGACLAVCPSQAIEARTDPLSEIKKYEYTIAVADMSLMGQFGNHTTPNDIIWGLMNMGFHYVHEVALDTEMITIVMQEYMQREPGKRPLISSLCPVITRLAQVRFPELLGHVVPVESVTEISVKNAKEEIAANTGAAMERIGAFYITPCPARVNTIKQPDIRRRSFIGHSIAISEIYRDLLYAIHNSGPPPKNFQRSTGMGLGWAAVRGEMESVNVPNSLVVDGLVNVIDIFESLENEFLEGVDYLECRACRTGCVGGALATNNRFLARSKIEKLKKMPPGIPQFYRDPQEREKLYQRFSEYFSQRFPQRAPEPIDADPARAIEKMKQIEDFRASLPGFNCGSCGAPTCRALAEDIVKGKAEITDCIFKLREKIEEVSIEFLKWRQKKPSPEENQE